jgi:hypothetical protein
MNASYNELKQEMDQMKRRIAALEGAFDSILTKEDLQAMDEAHEDLSQGGDVSLAQVKKQN